ncbi:MAG TPA: LysR family transcriptional regulator [Lautropia sp.]|nr:LysR family transcriptional regulator [Lautropia sp.]
MRDADLQDLLAFAAVAGARSFRGAAATRGVAASGLSAAVRRLEERLQVRLLNRTTRSVTATEAGARLLERLAPALAEVAAALDSVNDSRDEPVGTLRLNVPNVVARLILPDLLGRFLARHPGIRAEITAEDGFVDVLGQGYDAGVRYDERLEQDMIAVPIGPRHDRYVAVAAPAYLEQHGCPTHPRDLLGHQVIRHRFLHGVSLPWEFERDGEVVTVSPPARLLTGSLELQRHAVAAGLGIASTFEGFYRDLLDAGRVVEILADWSTPFPGPFLYYSGRRYLPAPLRAFVDFLHAEGRDKPAL